MLINSIQFYNLNVVEVTRIRKHIEGSQKSIQQSNFQENMIIDEMINKIASNKEYGYGMKECIKIIKDNNNE